MNTAGLGRHYTVREEADLGEILQTNTLNGLCTEREDAIQNYAGALLSAQGYLDGRNPNAACRLILSGFHL